MVGYAHAFILYSVASVTLPQTVCLKQYTRGDNNVILSTLVAIAIL